jgi:hypothetical protein
VHELESGSTTLYSGERSLAGPVDRVRDYDDDNDNECVIVMLICLGHFIFLMFFVLGGVVVDKESSFVRSGLYIYLYVISFSN